jgi:D-beta-D-heptose 7-phosphate kinase/D-beta-D-heptose 1-phosphate adenosyltransferase
VGRIVSQRALDSLRKSLRRRGKIVVFTNGTFDILHRGHVEYLARARARGDVLIVGLNTDASIRRIKGKGRPINPNGDRAAVLAALACVDYVCFFGGNTPARLIRLLVPDVLVKGADWKDGEIVGADVVRANGGAVRRIRLTPGRSTTGMIRKIAELYGKG